MNNPNPLLDVAAVAEYLDISTTTVWRLIARGTLASTRVGRQVRVRVSQIEDYLAASVSTDPHSALARRR